MNTKTIMDEITRTPRKRAIKGRAGKNAEATDTVACSRSGPHACINAGWLIEAPWAHPLWHSYYLTAMHLRHIEGMGPAHIYLEGATHEVVLFALQPDKSREPFAQGEDTAQLLQPANFIAQWIAKDDDEARDKVFECVNDIVAGKLSPDTDFRSEWIVRFSDSNVRGNAA